MYREQSESFSYLPYKAECLEVSQEKKNATKKGLIKTKDVSISQPKCGEQLWPGKVSTSQRGGEMTVFLASSWDTRVLNKVESTEKLVCPGVLGS